MLTFASTGLGMPGVILAFLVVGLTILLAVGLGLFCGIWLLRGKSVPGKLCGVILVAVAGVFIPMFFCLGPPKLLELMLGTYPVKNYPVDDIHEGMSAAAVKAILGPPDARYKNANEDTWRYYRDMHAISSLYIEFSRDGRVIRVYDD